MAFAISAGTDAVIDQVREAVGRLARVDDCVSVGVFE
jgi:hypothetical protein